MSTQVIVTHLPDCDLCQQDGSTTPAAYDGRTVIGPWANMCERHFKAYGVGLGLGKGQRLVVAES